MKTSLWPALLLLNALLLAGGVSCRRELAKEWPPEQKLAQFTGPPPSAAAHAVLVSMPGDAGC